MRQIIDWMMYVHNLSPDEWNNLIPLLRETGMDRLAFTVTAMCQRFLGLRHIVDEDDSYPVEDLMTYIIEKGNFGKKSGIDGRTASFVFTVTGVGSFLKRLQEGGLDRWKAAKKYKILRQFAWVYQCFRNTGELIRQGETTAEIISQSRRGIEQRKLIESLGLRMDRTIIS